MCIRDRLTGLLPDAVASRLPGGAAPAVPWRARHTAYEEGRMFRDEMVSGPLASWRHTHLLDDAAPGEADTADGRRGTVVTDHIEYALPGESLVSRVPGLGAAASRLSLIHISEPTRLIIRSRMPSSA